MNRRPPRNLLRWTLVLVLPALAALAPGRGQQPPSGTSRPLPAEPWKDPEARKLISQWIGLATRLRDQNDHDNAPHRISPFGGGWYGRKVWAVPPAEGWETKYQEDLHCYLWLAGGREHLDPVYKGELPPLHDFVKQRYGQGHPGTDHPGGHPPPKGPATPVTRMTLLAEDRRVRPGEVTSVAVWLRKGKDLASLNFDVQYDPKVAVLQGAPARGNLLGGALFSANPRLAPDRARFGVAGSAGLSGDGTVTQLVFRAVGPPGSFTPLRLSVGTAADPHQGRLDVDTLDGSIRILGPGEALRGDCNGDGVLDARDAQCALDMSTGLLRADLNLDMDGDGNVTAVDATLILQDRSRSLLSQGR